MRLHRFLLLAALPFTGFAHSISNEFGATATQPSDQVSTSGYLSNLLAGQANLSDTLALKFNLGLTYEEPARTLVGKFPENSGSEVFAASVAGLWTPNDHFELDAEADFSPSSTQFAASPLTIEATTTTAQADVLVRSVNSSIGGALTLDLSTANDNGFDVDGALSGAVTQFQSLQNVARVQSGSTTYTARELHNSCEARKTSAALCRSLAPALRGTAAELTQWKISASYTQTLWSTSDLTASGSYYLYDTDPTQVGFFSTLAAGRGIGSTQLGGGVPIAPLVFSLRPELAHRFGGFRASVWYQYGRYYGATGYSNAVGLRLQYRFNRSWRVWLSGSWQDDYQAPTTDSNGTVAASTTLSLAGALGVKYSW